MSAFGLLRRLLLLLFLVAALQAAYGASRLPALSALGFDATGAAAFYLPTWQIMWLHVGAAAVLAAAFWLVPDRWIDLPRSRLRPDPREALLRLATWLGVVSLLTLTALMQFVYDANLAPIPQLRIGPVLALGIAYLGFVVLWAWAWRGVRARGLAALAADAERERRGPADGGER